MHVNFESMSTYSGSARVGEKGGTVAVRGWDNPPRGRAWGMGHGTWRGSSGSVSTLRACQLVGECQLTVAVRGWDNPCSYAKTSRARWKLSIASVTLFGGSGSCAPRATPQSKHANGVGFMCVSRHAPRGFRHQRASSDCRGAKPHSPHDPHSPYGVCGVPVTLSPPSCATRLTDGV